MKICQSKFPEYNNTIQASQPCVQELMYQMICVEHIKQRQKLWNPQINLNPTSIVIGFDMKMTKQIPST